MSTHKVECVPVILEKHPDADSLSVVRVFGGYTVCVRTADWLGRDKGIYVEPDYVVPLTRPEFAFLQKPGESKADYRLKVKKLRGVVSYGLLIPAPDGAQIGQDFMADLSITRYEPPANAETGGESAPGPNIVAPKYDLENWRKYSALLIEGEQVSITEKIHGASGRYVFLNGVMHVGSRTEWKKDSERNLWWCAMRANPWLESWCRRNEGKVLYGEAYGDVSGFQYGIKRPAFGFAPFDVLDNGRWLSVPEFVDATLGLPVVPELASGPYSPGMVEAVASGQTILGKGAHIREGCVIKPVSERVCAEIGRVALKCVSNAFLEKS